MKNATLKQIWLKIESKFNSGNFSDVFVNCKDEPCVKFFNGQTATLPSALIKTLPSDFVQEMVEIAKRKSSETANRLKAERLEREKRLDEPRFTLLAGEDTDIVFQGTWRECRDNLWRLNCRQGNGKYLPRDYYSGKGCWAIVKGDFEAESGIFDKDGYY